MARINGGLKWQGEEEATEDLVRMKLLLLATNLVEIDKLVQGLIVRFIYKANWSKFRTT